MAPVFPPPPDFSLIAATVKTKLPFRVELAKLAPLAGDASNRRYFRLELAGGPPHSLIVMQLASPDAFKQSEEAVSGAAPAVTELPFVNILLHLAKAEGCDAFVSFDQRFAAVANTLSEVKVRTP